MRTLLVTTALVVCAWGSCRRESKGDGGAATSSGGSAALGTSAAPAGTVLATSGAMSTGPHPRILLDAERLAVVKDAAKNGTEPWKRTLVGCDEATQKTIPSGYQAEDWASAALDLALCGR